LPENIQMLVHNFSRCFFTFSTGVFLILLLMSTIAASGLSMSETSSKVDPLIIFEI